MTRRTPPSPRTAGARLPKHSGWPFETAAARCGLLRANGDTSTNSTPTPFGLRRFRRSRDRLEAPSECFSSLLADQVFRREHGVGQVDAVFHGAHVEARGAPLLDVLHRLLHQRPHAVHLLDLLDRPHLEQLAVGIEEPAL